MCEGKREREGSKNQQDLQANKARQGDANAALIKAKREREKD